MSRSLLAMLALTLVLAAGCRRAPPAGQAHKTPAAPSIENRDWELVALGERSDPHGASGRPVTLRLDSASGRAAGFAGCNRYSSAYALSADSLSFQMTLSTKMACPDGMEVEQAFLEALPAVRTFQATDSTLTLDGPNGALARFRAS
jgi:putative lipoprotein